MAQFPGDKFEFLKRTYELCEDGINVLPGRYAETMIESFEAKYGKIKAQQVPCGDEAQEISNGVLLPPDEATLYRSLVGSGIYLSQERMELDYVIKQLAGGMSSPSRGHLQVMRRLIGYLKQTLGNYSHLRIPDYGKGIHHSYDSKWILESFTDSDWSGDRSTRRSTSSGVHALNGMVLFHSSRGQRVVSLSSAEAELHGLVSGATDGMALRLCLEFLMEVKVTHVCLIDNSATKQIANKRGGGRLRHVSGKLLWVQDQTSSKVLEVKQIGTSYNVGDIGTKPLSKNRLYALMYWCDLYDKEGKPIGEEDAMRIKEAQMSKAKIMRVAKFLQGMVFMNGLELANRSLVPFRMDLETVTPAYGITWLLQMVPYVMLSMVMFAGFFLLYKVYAGLQREVRHLRAELQLMQNEAQMHHVHITAMHVGLIRAGGYVDLDQQISEQDWDNWHYVEKNNRKEDDRECRRSLASLRVAVGALKRRRRHTTPPRNGSRSRDDSEEMD